MPPAPAFFEQHEIRRVYDEATEIWWFSVVDILQALIQQPDYQTARKYWNKLKERLTKEGSESVTPENALPSRTRKTLKAPKSVTQTEGDESS